MDLSTIISYAEDAATLFGVVVAAASSVVGAVSLIAQKTKSVKDDAIVAKLTNLLAYASIFNAKLVKKK